MLNTYILSLDLRTNASATVPQEERQVTVNVHIQGDCKLRILKSEGHFL